MKTIVFFADAIGQAYNCIAIAQNIPKDNFKIIFVADNSFAGMFSKYGFTEHLLDIHGNDEESQVAQSWSNVVHENNAAHRLPTIEQIDTYITAYYKAIVEGAIKANPLLKKALAEIKPDPICFDDVVLYPAFKQQGCPWVRIISCNELEVPDPKLPPALSGYSTSDSTSYARFRYQFLASIQPIHEQFNQFLADHHEKPYPNGQFLELSPFQNLFIFPRAVAYSRSEAFHWNKVTYLNGCVRQEAPYVIPSFGVDIA
ncbi:hypothetical protein Lbir_1740 [Legionella birminghamensis]|uniref:Glycosyltransferase n=1 Tax=Legionella birminghamensis TaxID=28083 RepID=A0A378JUG4_9GAMM|nr:hypothetical protein [Legionella birminghamensis]KTC71402.1 hypothetical protein Lbir_1740 [Legionella birminghamensis]STX60968.1 Uncharacterised protein [Legionella birminghamensis]